MKLRNVSSDLNCSKNNCLFTQFNAKTHAKCELIYITDAHESEFQDYLEMFRQYTCT